MIEIARIPAFRDNYIWLLHDPDSGETVVVDPGEADAVLAEADRRGWRIGQIWNTHWHADHTGGNAAIKAATGCRITGPAAEFGKIPTLDVQVKQDDRVRMGAFEAHVLEIPAHTAGHIAFHLPQAELVFVGDTLFAMGCGRLFEGSAEQMWQAMQLLGALPPQTRVYCGHEYTQSNGRYARVAEPDNVAIATRMRDVDAARDRGEATLPTTIALELATNPFMRAGSAEELARRRAEKDSFSG
ncbi:hydroxyacylglutathione hydrolase [Sphingomonas sp. ASY06-1R]|jgi:hydroxyacylglutathione hydrolase|uniref:hydroxyacylglutathione hydrolase n=1 Tax=Sphingomonas sp. ASY06-1R TaxID=3445771 RepID=UPI003FA2105E